MEVEHKTSLRRRVLETLRRNFAGGVLVTVPVVVTLAVLYFLFQKVDGLLSPWLNKLLGYSIPGMGLVATLLLILLAGALTRNVLGSRLYAIGEILFIRTPLVRAIYTAVKQLVEAVTLPQKKGFDQVVMVEYPRKGLFVLAFASARFVVETGRRQGDFVAVYLPSTPTPVTGWVILVPREDVIPMDISLEEAIKIAMSGGITMPPRIREKTAPAIGAHDKENTP